MEPKWERFNDITAKAFIHSPRSEKNIGMVHLIEKGTDLITVRRVICPSEIKEGSFAQIVMSRSLRVGERDINNPDEDDDGWVTWPERGVFESKDEEKIKVKCIRTSGEISMGKLYLYDEIQYKAIGGKNAITTN